MSEAPYFWNRSHCKVKYATVRKAMKGKAYPMSLTGPKEIQAIILAVNEGIDAHLEACYAPERGDRYEPGVRKTASGIVHTTTLECTVSVESLPVLLRRLFDLKLEDNTDIEPGSAADDDSLYDAGQSLAEDILMTLGINDAGVYVGRQALGLE